VSGRARDVPAALDTAAQLRDLTRDAHAAAKDLRAAIREARALVAGLDGMIETRINDRIAELNQHVRADAQRYAAELNAGIVIAKRAIIDALTLAEIIPDDDFKTMRVRFKGPLIQATEVK
jgi:hypothetical protein